MCHACKTPVETFAVLSAVDLFAQLLQFLGLNASVNLGIAIRVIARLAQDGKWNELMARIDSGDVSASSEAETYGEATFAQMRDYARDFPLVTDEMIVDSKVRDNYSAVLQGLAMAQAPLSNELTAGMLALSEMMLESPIEPPTRELVASAVDTAVFLTNAQKDSGNFSIN
jgi:hypothetical protein